MVDEPEGDGKGPGHPGIGRIFSVHIALYDLLALAQVVVHFPQKFRMDEVVSVEDDKGVVLLFLGQHLRKHPVQSVALADFVLICPHLDDRAVFPADLLRIVRTVIGHDVYVVHVLRIIQVFQVIDQLPDDAFLIMRANYGSKGIFRCCRNVLSSLHQAENSQGDIIQRIKYNDNLYGYHNDIQYMFHTRSP